eukprot:Em0018g1026a
MSGLWCGAEGNVVSLLPLNIILQALSKDSPIREIFGGQLYFSVHRQGNKESVIMEPFFSLQLALQSDEVRTVQQALDSMVTREVVHMNAGSEAERFLYNANGGGLQKLMKPVEYSIDLEISKEGMNTQSLYPYMEHQLIVHDTLEEGPIEAAH